MTPSSIYNSLSPSEFRPSSGLLYWEDEMLVFLSTDGRRMSFPDQNLSFLGSHVSVTNSCNGPIREFREDIWPEIFARNPVTTEKRSILKADIGGLDLNPSIPGPYYKLLCPYRVDKKKMHIEYGFDLFSSSIGVWRKSEEWVKISSRSVVTDRAFFVDGLLYFRATDDALWFNIDKDLADIGSFKYNLEEQRSQLPHLSESLAIAPNSS
ncbi:hypothetical protein IFM89_004915 [Coptis chinensis]|uniref:F-box protein n=1 Tax=Coptis chinensis TaxID=261450 RepID=A0A835LUW6_9MAGN|nr:hypothetical protein IFM89_004915 [Coptis chinensis]